ncbi:hypothetical protein Bcav_1814 [Beutenbergia cavernae DSM 12333]|uniref:Uncharacterized protein n=1 Tax=Beutenbergia cavernae (strain ATCC BAA-8 / DSM 12333 / CCUG 43141 / JCM 11478 / NBRC 16432 / NCIMB 13614 / HKI 0122) TaxID=471853 RepID=C5C4U2_BEUC1|nr:hypothetical protein [Beutenbergia cavernae]ACQ80070.1 hypothetical protein Bcav_1814 [Beutenbergia cavernae DSM 12333]
MRRWFAEAYTGVRSAVAGPVAGFLLLLVLADAMLILLHLSLKTIGEPAGFWFDLGVDRGYAEFFQYLKVAWSAVLSVLLWTKVKSVVFLVWALVFTVYVTDDWFQLHERAGAELAARFPDVPAAWHVGELLLTGAVGLVLVVLVWWTYRRAAPEGRGVSRTLAVLMSALVAVGILLDAVHHILLPGAAFDVPLTTLEDGGELLLMSVVVAYLLATTFVRLPGRQDSAVAVA